MTRAVVVAALLFVIAGCGGREPSTDPADWPATHTPPAPLPGDEISFGMVNGEPTCAGPTLVIFTETTPGAARPWLDCEWLCARYQGVAQYVAIIYWREAGRPWRAPDLALTRDPQDCP